MVTKEATDTAKREEIRQWLRGLRQERPDITPVEARDLVTREFDVLISVGNFWITYWKKSDPSRANGAKPRSNGGKRKAKPAPRQNARRGWPKRIALTKRERDQVGTAVVQAPEFPVAKNAENIPATTNGRGASKVRVLFVEAELGEADLRNIAQMIGAVLAGRP